MSSFLIHVTGAPSCGKDSMIRELVPMLEDTIPEELVVLSTGEKFRELFADPEHHHVANLVKRGFLVPNDITVPIVETVLINEIKKGPRVVVTNGVLRTVKQYAFLRNLSRQLGCEQVILGIHENPENIANRLMKLAQTGERGRQDDHPESIGNRLTEFRNKTAVMMRVVQRVCSDRFIDIDVDGPENRAELAYRRLYPRICHHFSRRAVLAN